MHCPWTRKSRAWGYEVVRGIDEDDPLRVIRAFREPVGLAFVDLDTQVEIDYGGYAWTQWMHGHFGDTALHIALKWKRHRAVKALLSLRPSWTIQNEAGVTAEQIVLQMYGKDMATFKNEQEREYENEAMRDEEEATRRLMAAEQAARDSARLKFLQELHAARTLGIQREAAILFEHGRVVLPEETAFSDRFRGSKRCRRRPTAPVEPYPEERQDEECANSVAAATDDGGHGNSNDGERSDHKARDRWVSHICRELRRNRFAAQRGAMRRNVLPARAPTSAGAAGTSPSLTTTGRSVGCSRTDAKSTARVGRSPRTKASAASYGTSGEGTKRRTKKLNAVQTHATSGQQQSEEERQEGEDGHDGDIMFDASSAVGSGRWPSAKNNANTSGVKPDRGRSTSPLRVVSPNTRGFTSKSVRKDGGNSIVSSPTSFGGGGASIRSGSGWGGGKAGASPTRFDRSSRMSTMRTTRILAAGKSLQRLTPEDRLQRKMAARSVARTPQTRLASGKADAATAVGPGKMSPPFNALGSSPSRSPQVLPVPVVAHVQHKDGASDLSVAVEGSRRNNAVVCGTSVMPGGNSGAVQAVGTLVQHGGAVAIDETSDSGTLATSRKDTGVAREDGDAWFISGGCTTVERGLRASRGSAPPNNLDSSDHQQDGWAASHTIGKPDAVQNGRHHQGLGHGSRASCGETKPHQPRTLSCSMPGVYRGDDDRSLFPSTAEKEDVDEVLSGVREGPTKDLLVTLLTSTVMTEDGGRVLAPSFSSISAMHELKYCGPVEPSYAFALERAIFARPGVLLRLSLPGKRIGDEEVIALAPALPSIRIVDLRSNNIGDNGTKAIASALWQQAATATAAETSKMGALHNRRGRAGESHINRNCGMLQSLSLAGNRIGDAGATALSEMLEEEKEEKSRNLVESQYEDRNEASPISFERLRFLGWLSVAGNPGVSDNAKRRLLRAGSNRRVVKSRDGNENDPPPMVVIV